jgi:iron complex outermembrane receptor protein
MLSLEFYKRGALPSSARRYTASDLTSLGGSNFDTDLSNPGTLLVNGQTYAIPAGQNGTGLNTSNFVAGTRSLSNVYQSTDILPSQKRWSFYGSVKESLQDDVAVYGNAMISRREAKQLTGGQRTDFIVTPLNPFYVNPTGGTDPVTVGYNFLNDIGPTRTDVTVNNVNITLGLDVAVSSAWKMNLYANYAQEKGNQLTDGLVDFAALNDALMDTDPATAFNPFGDGSHTNPATLKSIATNSRFYTNSKLRTADVTADGPLGHLPGGDIQLALGIDRRNQVFSTLEPANGNSPLIDSDNSRNVTAAFGEIRVPLFGPANSRRGLRQLELAVAGRYEHYSDFGHAATPKLGLAWTPFEGVAFRGTWGRSIRAPTLADLDASQNVLVPFALPDPSSPQGVAHVLIESGKNPGLTVEHARSWTVGLDIDAREWVSGLTFSATWFNIRFRDRIDVPPPFDLSVLSNPGFASLITRNPGAALVSAACSTGTYTGGTSSDCAQYPADAILDIRSQNRQSLSTRGIDVSSTFERSWPPGTLKARLDGTYLLDFTQQDGPDTPPQQLLNTQNNPIDIKLRGLLSWQQRRWAATVAVNFQNRYKDLGSEPRRNIGSYTTFDAQLRYDLSPFGTGLLQNTLLELNAINVFNVSPPFLNNSIAQLGYDQENADPYGRLISFQVRKSW